MDAKGLNWAGLYKHESKWVTDPKSIKHVSGGEFIRAIHVRMNTLKTGERSSRGTDRFPVGRHCNTCRDQVQSLGHILQVCPRTHGARVLRHDAFVKGIRSALHRARWKTVLEPRVPVGRSFLKPDLIVWKGNQAYVLDPTIVSDGFDMQKAYNTKLDLYDCEEVKTYARKLIETDGGKMEDFSVHGIVCNWRGNWFLDSAEALRKLKVPASYLNYLTVRHLNDSWKMWSMNGLRTN